MTQEQMQITMAYEEVKKQLQASYEEYLRGCEEDPDSYDGITKDDAIVWFIESF